MFRAGLVVGCSGSADALFPSVELPHDEIDQATGADQQDTGVNHGRCRERRWPENLSSGLACQLALHRLVTPLDKLLQLPRSGFQIETSAIGG